LPFPFDRARARPAVDRANSAARQRDTGGDSRSASIGLEEQGRTAPGKSRSAGGVGPGARAAPTVLHGAGLARVRRDWRLVLCSCRVDRDHPVLGAEIILSEAIRRNSSRKNGRRPPFGRRFYAVLGAIFGAGQAVEGPNGWARGRRKCSDGGRPWGEKPPGDRSSWSSRAGSVGLPRGPCRHTAAAASICYRHIRPALLATWCTFVPCFPWIGLGRAFYRAAARSYAPEPGAGSPGHTLP